MTLGAKILGFATAAGLIVGLTIPALGQTTTTNPNTSPPSTCTNNTTTNTEASSGTTGTSTGTNTTVSSTEPNSSAPPVSPNTPANTNAPNIDSNNPGAHATTQSGNPCKNTKGTQPMAAPPSGTMNQPATAPAGIEMNALTNNPNGSNWTDKFNRPVARMSTMGTTHYAAGRHHKSKHRTKRASGGGGH